MTWTKQYPWLDIPLEDFRRVSEVSRTWAVWPEKYVIAQAQYVFRDKVVEVLLIWRFYNIHGNITQGLSFFIKDSSIIQDKDADRQTTVIVLRKGATKTPLRGFTHVGTIIDGIEQMPIQNYQHLMFWTHKQMRGTQLAHVLFDTYSDIFWAPQKEITHVPSLLNFYLWRGYKITKIHVPYDRSPWDRSVSWTFESYHVWPNQAEAIRRFLQSIKKETHYNMPVYVEVEKIPDQSLETVFDEAQVERAIHFLEAAKNQLTPEMKRLQSLWMDFAYFPRETVNIFRDELWSMKES
jgi:hypothetical protein